MLGGCAYVATGDVAKGVYLQNTNVSGMNRATLKSAVEEYFMGSVKSIQIEDPTGKVMRIPVVDLGIQPDSDATVERILSYGYESSFFSMVATRIKLIFQPVHVKPVYKVNDTVMQAFFLNYARSLKLEGKPATVDVVDGKVVVKKGEDGTVLDVEKMRAAIMDTLESNEETPVPTMTKIGVLNEREDQLKNIDTILASYTTRYDTGASSRSHNIGLAAKQIDNIYIGPGETFSYNKIVGERTSEMGYEEAPVIENGQIVSGIGGGICQVSSTLYDAALYAGMEIVERTNHYRPVSYVDPGLDATVSYGSLDLVFRNPFTHGVYIVVHNNNGELTIFILGAAADKYDSVTVDEISSSVVPNRTITKTDSSITGTKVEEEGFQGLEVVTKRTLKKAGKEPLVETHTSYYDPLDKVIINGNPSEGSTPKAGKEKPSAATSAVNNVKVIDHSANKNSILETNMETTPNSIREDSLSDSNVQEARIKATKQMATDMERKALEALNQAKSATP